MYRVGLTLAYRSLNSLMSNLDSAGKICVTGDHVSAISAGPLLTLLTIIEEGPPPTDRGLHILVQRPQVLVFHTEETT